MKYGKKHIVVTDFWKNIATRNTLYRALCKMLKTEIEYGNCIGLTARGVNIIKVIERVAVNIYIIRVCILIVYII